MKCLDNGNRVIVALVLVLAIIAVAKNVPLEGVHDVLQIDWLLKWLMPVQPENSLYR